MEEQTQHRTTSSARLRFVLGKQARDVALPAEVPLADLLPAILPQFDAEVVEQGAEHEGWVVQRIGEEPLDEDRTLGELNVLDGESLHLRPRAAQLAAIDYDDLVDGVGEQVRGHPGGMTADRAKWTFRGGAVLALLLGAFLVVGSGPAAMQAQLAAGAALILLLASAMAARGAAKPDVATILAAGAMIYAAVGGASVVVFLDPLMTPMVRLTGAAAAALVTLAAAAVLVADAALLFTGAIVFTTILTLTGVIGSITPTTAGEAAAIGMVLSLILGLFVPQLAFRLSGLTLPMLPTGADELSEDIEPVPHKVVVERGAAAFGYSTALYVGLGLAQSLLLPLLVIDGYGWSMVLSLVMALLLLLRSRHPRGVVQRCAVLVPAGIAVMANVAHIATEQSPAGRLLLFTPLVLFTGLLLLMGAEQLPGRRLRPYWGRAVEVFESITAVAILPILLQVLHVYAFMRALAG